MNLNYTINDKHSSTTNFMEIVIKFEHITAKSYDKICSIFSIHNEYIGDDLIFETNFNKLIKSFNNDNAERYCISNNTMIWLEENSFERVLVSGAIYDGSKKYHLKQIISRIEKYLLENFENK